MFEALTRRATMAATQRARARAAQMARAAESPVGVRAEAVEDGVLLTGKRLAARLVLEPGTRAFLARLR